MVFVQRLGFSGPAHERRGEDRHCAKQSLEQDETQRLSMSGLGRQRREPFRHGRKRKTHDQTDLGVPGRKVFGCDQQCDEVSTEIARARELRCRARRTSMRGLVVNDESSPGKDCHKISNIRTACCEGARSLWSLTEEGSDALEGLVERLASSLDRRVRRPRLKQDDAFDKDQDGEGLEQGMVGKQPRRMFTQNLPDDDMRQEESNLREHGREPEDRAVVEVLEVGRLRARHRGRFGVVD